MPPVDPRRWLLALGLTVAGAGSARAAAQVWGTVVDSAGRPVANLMVDLSGPGFMRRGGTDGQGRFVIWDAPPGRPLSVRAIDDRGRFSGRRSVVPPDTVPPLLFPVRRDSRGMRIDSAQVTRDMRRKDPAHRSFGCVGQQCSMSYLADVGQLYC